MITMLFAESIGNDNRFIGFEVILDFLHCHVAHFMSLHFRKILLIFWIVFSFCLYYGRFPFYFNTFSVFLLTFFQINVFL